MTRFVISRPVATLMLFLGLMTLGIISLKKMPVSLLPSVEVPVLRIYIQGQGLDAATLEREQVGPVREYLSALHQLKEINSIVHDNYGWITLRFSFRVNMDYKLAEIKEKLDLLYEHLPGDLPAPRVMKGTLNNLPLMMLNVTASDSSLLDLEDISHYCRQVLKRRLEQFEEVAFADITGAPQIFTRVSIEQADLMNAGLTLHDLSLLLSAPRETMSMKVKDGNYLYTLYFDSWRRSDTWGNTMFRDTKGRFLNLNGILKIETVKKEGGYLFNGSPAIGIAILKGNTGTYRSLQDKINGLVEELKFEEPEIDIAVSADRSSYIDDSISGLLNNLLLGLILSTTLAMIVFKHHKATVILMLSIPVSLCLSILAMYIMGLGFNIVTLSGLILAVGLMIDNSIIVMDNIEREIYFRNEISPAVISGTEEVIRPLVSSQLTTCVVFIPLVLLSDTAGAIFREQAIAVICGLASSLSVSLFLLPNLVVILYNHRDIHRTQPLSFAVHVYEALLLRSVRRPFLLLFTLAVWLLAGAALISVIPKRSFPVLPDRTRVFKILTDNADPGSADTIVTLVHGLLPGKVSASTYLGVQDFLCVEDTPSEPNEIYLVADFPDDATAEKVSAHIMERINERLPYIRVEAIAAPHPFSRIFGKEQDMFEIRLYSLDAPGMPHPDSVRSLTADLDLPGSILSEIVPYTLVQVNQERSLIHDVSLGSVSESITACLHETGLSSGDHSDHPVIIKTLVAPGLPLAQVPVPNRHGNYLPLGSIANIFDSSGYSIVRADRTGPYFPMAFDPSICSFPGITRLAAQRGLSAGLRSPFHMDENLMKQLLSSLALSVMLLYFILAIQFNSAVQPLIILSELMIDISGALIVIFLTGNSLNIMSCTGIIIMSGIIINDSILKVDAINRCMAQGKSLARSIFVGGRKRFRPIVMTSLTTVLALLPVLVTPGTGQALQEPLAAAITGGLLTGTFVSLFFIPLAYSWEKSMAGKLKIIWRSR